MAQHNKKGADDLSVNELEQLLYQKKHSARRQRLRRLQQDGRVVNIDGIEAPNQLPPRLGKPQATPTGALNNYALKIESNGEDGHEPPESSKTKRTGRGRWLANKLLLFVEITAIVGLAFVLYTLVSAQQELNQELTAVQRAEVAVLGPPTPTPSPLIDLVVLPTGHRYIDGRSPEPVESGDIPAHLLPALQEYKPPPIPTPGPEQAQVIQIPAIGVHHAIVEGAYDWEQLKRGVAHYVGSAQPGQNGNMVLAAHNDIYGAIFKDLDKLSPGDEIIVSTNQQVYTYVITDIDVVEPTSVDVMDATEHASATLISCYPYRINTERIVVFADLVSEPTS